MRLIKFIKNFYRRFRPFSEVYIDFPDAKQTEKRLRLSEAFLIRQEHNLKESLRQAQLINEYLKELLANIDKAIEKGERSITLNKSGSYHYLNGTSAEYIREYLRNKGYDVCHIMAGNYCIRW